MKKSIKIVGLLSIVALFAISSCRKNDDGEYDRSDFEDAVADTKIVGQEFYS